MQVYKSLFLNRYLIGINHSRIETCLIILNRIGFNQELV